MTKHPDRKELLAAALKGDRRFAEHLASCEECQTLTNLARTYQVAGEPPLADAPRAWLRRAAAIAVGSDLKISVKTIMARLVFDSWATPHLVGVRGGNSMAERRLRFESDELHLDLRAELSERKWAFVAQISPKSSLTGQPVLQVDAKQLVSGKHELFEWVDSRAPRNISIRSGDLVIQLPELKWRKKKSD